MIEDRTQNHLPCLPFLPRNFSHTLYRNLKRSGSGLGQHTRVTYRGSVQNLGTQVPSDLHSHLVHMCGFRLELRLRTHVKTGPGRVYLSPSTGDREWRVPGGHRPIILAKTMRFRFKEHLSQKLRWQRGLRASQRQAFAFTCAHARTNEPTACWQGVFCAVC